MTDIVVRDYRNPPSPKKSQTNGTESIIRCVVKENKLLVRKKGKQVKKFSSSEKIFISKY